MPEASVHPTPAELSAFGLGKLNDADATTVAQHLETCLDCRRSVEELSGDSFLGLVKAAKPANSILTVSVAKSPLLPETLPSAPPQALLNLPPELAAHPKFRIVRELGRGGMGIVYLAEHRLMERQVAIKVINKNLLDHPGALERFHREVKAAAQLTHPNIVTAYDAETAGDLHLLVMEYVAGTDLAKVVAKHTRLPVRHTCTYARQAAMGLQHAFEKGMVHRDIKPQNLMLTAEGRVKILDFGLARLVSEQKHGQELTEQNAMMGTPAYMSPEQGNDAHAADIRADIYSLGCTLYCLLTGEPPFAGGSPMHVIFAHKYLNAKLLHEINPEVPPRLSAVVATMMAKEPGRRFQKPAEVAQALAPFCKATAVTADKPDAAETPVVRRDELTYSAFPPMPLPGNPVARPRRQRKTRLGVVALAVFCACLVGLLGGMLLLKTKYGTIVLENLPDQAEVTLDGQMAILKTADGITYEIRAEAGRKHRLQVKKEGFQVFGQEIEIDAGGSKPITVRLRPLPAEVTKPAPPHAVADSTSRVLPGHILQGHANAVVRVLFTPDGSRVVSASNGDRHIYTQRGRGRVRGTDNSVRVWDTASGQQIRKFDLTERSRYGTQGMAVSADGKLLAVAASWFVANGDAEPMVYVWDLDNGERKNLFPAPGESAIRAVNFSEDGSMVVAVRSGPGGVHAWSLADERHFSRWPLEGTLPGNEAPRMTISRGSRYILSGVFGGGSDICVWEHASRKIVKTLSGHTKPCSEVVLSPDESRILTCAGDATVRLWDRVTGQQLLCLKLDTNVHCVAFSPNGRFFVAGNENGTVRLHDTATGKELARMVGPKAVVNDVAYSPDSRLIASVGADNTVRLWKIEPAAVE